MTFLLFLKMADEQAKPPFNKLSSIAALTWIVAEVGRGLRVVDGGGESEGLALANLGRAAHLRHFILPKAFLGEFHTRSDGQPLSNQWRYIWPN